MILAPHETERFYRIWRPLLGYVNRRLRLVADFSAKLAHGRGSPTDIRMVREALWRDDSLLAQYVAENPEGLAPADLALVESWRRRVAGRFYLYRHLKKHTVVLSANGVPRAYGVLGLVSPLSEVARQPPPVLVEMVLLPFEDRITYDGLIAPFGIAFGPGIRAELDDLYRAARERGGVLTSLLPAEAEGAEELRSRLRAGNNLVLKELRKELSATGMTQRKVDEHMEHAEAVAEALLQAQEPRPLLDVSAEDLRAALARQGPGSRVSLKRLARFLERSGRVEWGTLGGIPELG
ncbi:MAG: hypothetical protein ACK47B_09230 [Armatimonadota bacterium]